MLVVTLASFVASCQTLAKEIFQELRGMANPATKDQREDTLKGLEIK